MLESVVNVSECTDLTVIAELSDACGASLLDTHLDKDHNRSVFTLAGDDLVASCLNLAVAAIDRIDIVRHSGVHPRIGVVDVVPFVPIGIDPFATDIDLTEALEARAEFAQALVTARNVPCFLYGPERSLPDVRRGAFRTMKPDVGPAVPHPRAGACCVGARSVLVAYNVLLRGGDVSLARRIATDIRSDAVRSLGFEVGGQPQVSCNLIDPLRVGVEATYDMIDRRARAEGAAAGQAELVGLVPERLLVEIPRRRWSELGLSDSVTIESRLAAPR
jgi:glutamate formiminotransferase